MSPSPASVKSEGFRARMLRVAIKRAHIKHPNLLATRVVRDEQGEPQLEIEACQSPRLPELLADGPLGLRASAKVVADVAAAADALASHAMIARDLVPERIFVDRKRGAILADLGIPPELVAVEQDESGPQRVYRSPEEREGEGIDARSTVYSLAALFITAATGKRPPERFEARSENGGAAVPDLERVVAKAMAPNPRERFAGPAEFVKALEASVVQHERRLKEHQRAAQQATNGADGAGTATAAAELAELEERRRDEEAAALAAAQAQQRAEAEERARREADERERREAEERRRAEEQAAERERQEAEAKAAREAEERAAREAEKRRRAEAAAAAAAAAEARKRAEAEHRAAAKEAEAAERARQEEAKRQARAAEQERQEEARATEAAERERREAAKREAKTAQAAELERQEDAKREARAAKAAEAQRAKEARAVRRAEAKAQRAAEAQQAKDALAVRRAEAEEAKRAQEARRAEANRARRAKDAEAAERRATDRAAKKAARASRAQSKSRTGASRRAGSLFIAAAVAVGAFVGAVVATSGGGGEDRELASNAVTLQLREGWHEANASGRGLARFSDPVAATSEAGAGIDVGRVSDVRATERTLSEALPEAQPRAAVQLGELQAWRYSGLRPRAGQIAVAYLAYTTEGPLVILCHATAANAATHLAQCGRVAATARLQEGRPLRLAAVEQSNNSLQNALAALRAARSEGRAKFAKAPIAREQAAQARSLESSFETAARRVDGIAAPVVSLDGLAASLRETADAYGRLGKATQSGDGAAYDKAREAVLAAEAKLRQQVTRVAPR